MSKNIYEEWCGQAALEIAEIEDRRFMDEIERCVECDHLKAHHTEDGKCLFGPGKYNTIVGKIE